MAGPGRIDTALAALHQEIHTFSVWATVRTMSAIPFSLHQSLSHAYSNFPTPPTIAHPSAMQVTSTSIAVGTRPQLGSSWIPSTWACGSSAACSWAAGIAHR